MGFIFFFFFGQTANSPPVGSEEAPRIGGSTMTDLQKEQVKTMRLQGIGYVKIGEMLGISDNTVRSF